MRVFLRLTVLLSIILFSCNSNEKKQGTVSNPGTLTENEDKGIKEIIGFYGGQCEYGFEKKLSTGQGNETIFWIKFSKSADIDSLQQMAEMPSSNIAYIFYKNLDKEKSKYSQIESELIFGSGESLKYSYPIFQLEKVKSKLLLVNKIVSLIKDKDFKGIKKYLGTDTVLFNYDKDNLISNLQNADPNFGSVKEFTPYGFKFSKADNGKEILHISGLLTRDKQSHYLSFNLDPNTLKDEIYSLDYKL